MAAYVFDIEADSLLEDITKIHCLCFTATKDLNVSALIDYNEIKKWLSQPDLTLIGHNIVRYDIPALEKVLGIKIQAKLVDTLGISYYLNSSNGRLKQGLESYGEDFGIPKPPVYDWKNEDISVYVDRCTEDVKINHRLWKEQQEHLMELYNRDINEVIRLIDYISFKEDCMVEQNNNRIPVDIDLLSKEIARFEDLVEEKYNALVKVMPSVTKYKTVNKPKRMYNKEGELTIIGQRWVSLLKEHGHEIDDDISELSVIDYVEEPNPNSNPQIKDWLYSLGWKPVHYRFERNKTTGEVKQIPQVTSEKDKTEICESIVELAEQKPELHYLSGYSTVKHRYNIFKGFLRDMDSDLKLVGDALGYTNTFRFKHRVLVNLPKASAPYAENIRACLVAGENYYMMGADLSGIEDATKQHYIFPFDPDYVKEMQSGSFDAHTSVAVAANLMTVEEEEFFKKIDKSEDKSVYSEEDIKEYKRLKLIRQDAKVVNFSAIYSVGVPTLARNMKKPEKEAKKILDAYWKKNYSVKEFVKTCETKTVRDQLWVKQSVSGFWYTLRYSKDIFSTVNQSTAVYVFDTWIKHTRNQGLKISFQSHDEQLQIIHNSIPKEIVSQKIKKAIALTNEELKLNVEIGCSMDFGKSYLDCH